MTILACCIALRPRDRTTTGKNSTHHQMNGHFGHTCNCSEKAEKIILVGSGVAYVGKVGWVAWKMKINNQGEQSSWLWWLWCGSCMFDVKTLTHVCWEKFRRSGWNFYKSYLHTNQYLAFCWTTLWAQRYDLAPHLYPSSSSLKIRLDPWEDSRVGRLVAGGTVYRKATCHEWKVQSRSCNKCQQSQKNKRLLSVALFHH